MRKFALSTCMRPALLLLGAAGAVGCAMTPSSPNGSSSSSATEARHFQIYDNEKDWGPNHLAGPPDAPAVPGRHIEDQRTVPPDPEGERPSGSGAEVQAADQGYGSGSGGTAGGSGEEGSNPNATPVLP
jgi:hypothetical protein